MKYELEGEILKKLPFDLIKCDDLIYFEGPVLSYFKDKNYNDYFMRWIEMDDQCNRWMLFQVSKENVLEHLNGQVTLLSLINRAASGIVYFIDINSDIEFKQINCVQVSKIPNGYLPSEQSYFEMKYVTQYAQQLQAELYRYLNYEDEHQKFFE
jgi:hypothetical protein